MARRPTRRRSGSAGTRPRRSLANHTFEHFRWFAESCKLPDGLGNFRVEDYEEAFLRDYFGAAPGEGVPENLWILPTGQRKSMLLGLLALHCATYVRANARVFILGGLGGHGRNALDAAAGFVERDPKRLGRWWVLQEYGMGRLKSLIDRGRIIVVSAGRRVGGRAGSSVEGENPDLILVEELHRHEDDGGAMRTLQSKDQKKSHGGWIVPTVIVTTAGDNLDSALGRMIERATNTAEGAIVTNDRDGEYYTRAIDADGDLVMHRWEVPDEIQPPRSSDGTKADLQRFRRELTAYLLEVKKANPASFVRIDNLRRSFKKLQKEIWTFQRQHANQWVVQAEPALDRVGWMRGQELGSTIPAGVPGVVVGMDLSDSFDSSALVPVWRESSAITRTSGAQILKPKGKSALERKLWLYGVIDQMREIWPDLIVAFDRHYGGGHVVAELEERGITCVDVGQGVPFELGSMLLAKLVAEGNFKHTGDPELTKHAVAVCRRKSYGTRWRLDQPPDGRPIDGIAAAANGVLIAHNPPKVTAKASPGMDIW